MGYIATRHQYSGGEYGQVEVTYDKGFIGKDVIKAKYTGEGMEFDDPRAAVETAILIRNQWQHDEPDMVIGYGFGSLIDQSVASNTTYDAGKLRTWATDRVSRFPRCEWCGAIIHNVDNLYTFKDYPGTTFCSAGCGAEWLDDINTPAADKAAGAVERAGRAADRELDHAEEVTRRDIEFHDENRQNI